MEKLTDPEKDILRILPATIESLKGLSTNSKIGPTLVEYLVSELGKLEGGLRYLNKIRDHKPS